MLDWRVTDEDFLDRVGATSFFVVGRDDRGIPGSSGRHTDDGGENCSVCGYR